ncbi:EB domain containing protein, partial [Aphelenchoides avenae]
MCVCANGDLDRCFCECDRQLGYSLDRDGKTCRRTRRRLKEKCKSDMECQAAFSECTSGGCRCKEGFQRDGAGGCKPIAYKCVNHAEPLKFDNKVVMCTVLKRQRRLSARSKHRTSTLAHTSADASTTSTSLDVAESTTSLAKVYARDKRSELEKPCPSQYYCVAVFDVPKQPDLYQ